VERVGRDELQVERVGREDAPALSPTPRQELQVERMGRDELQVERVGR
jgi:hypothetical protein